MTQEGINFPELTIIEILASELDTSVVDLLSLENASTSEAVEEVTKISVEEKQHVLSELRIRSYLKIVIETILFFALIKTSKILDDHGIYGQGQVLTMGLLGFVGALIGMEIYTVKNLYLEAKQNIQILEWKWIDGLLFGVAIFSILVYLGIQFFVGYGPDNITKTILLLIITISIQVVLYRACNLRILRMLPIFLTMLFAMWGTWLYLTSEAWINAEIGDLVSGYISPFVGCCLGWLFIHRRRSGKR